MNKRQLFYIRLFGMIFLITWFLCIWIAQIREQLFFTGLFSLILTLLLGIGTKKK